MRKMEKKSKRKNRTKRYTAALTLAAMLVTTFAGALTGCGRSADAGAEGVSQKAESGTGRYAEAQIEFPQGVDAAAVFQLARENETPVLYAAEGRDAQADQKVTLRRFEYVEDGWKENTPQWLTNVDIQAEELGEQLKVLMDDTASYLYYTVNMESGSMGQLLRSSDGSTYSDITPQDWKEEDPEYHYYDAPIDLGVTEDGAIVASFYWSTRMYQGETGALLASQESQTQYYEKLCMLGNRYALLQRGENYLISEVDVFDAAKLAGTGAGGAQESASEEALDKAYPFEQKTDGSVAFDALVDGTLYIATPDGFYEKKADSDSFEEIINGAYTSFSMLSMWVKDMAAFANGTFMALFEDNTGKQSLMQYVYDETLSLTPERELTVYTLFDSSTLQQAAALFMKKHPETLVSVHVGMPNTEIGGTDSNAENEQKRMNTALISGEGEDVLIVDGMDADNLAAKGILVDMKKELAPLLADGTLLANIAGACEREDGSMPLIPLRFAMDILVSKEVPATEISDMKTLAQTLSKQKKSVLGARTSDDLVDMFAPYFTADIVKNKQLDREALKTNLEYLKQIADNCGIVKDYGESERGYNIWEIASKVDAALYHDAGFSECMLPLSAARLVKGSFASFENAFYPLLQIGVNQNSKQQELAKEFVLFCLSEEVQDSDFYDGYPVNSRSLATQQKADYSNYEAYTDIEIEDGQYTEFKIESFQEAEGAQLVENCKALTRRAADDAMISGEIKKAIPGYLAGSKSVEDTITEIEGGLKMYLAE